MPQVEGEESRQPQHQQCQRYEAFRRHCGISILIGCRADGSMSRALFLPKNGSKGDKLHASAAPMAAYHRNVKPWPEDGAGTRSGGGRMLWLKGEKQKHRAGLVRVLAGMRWAVAGGGMGEDGTARGEGRKGG